MYKLLLADDEPLVLVGLQGMLPWLDYDVELVGTARTGAAALEMIEALSPDIVITDIKMPVKTGLEVMKACKEQGKQTPVFIMLTSFEEFSFAQEAVRLGAVDYLVKLELTQQTLACALTKAIERVKNLHPNIENEQKNSRGTLASFHDKMFIRLYNNLFEHKEQFLRQSHDLNIHFNSQNFCVAYCEIVTACQMSTEKLMQLYAGTMEIVRDTSSKYLTCHLTSLDMRHFAICFCKNDDTDTLMYTALEKAITLVKNYFSVELLCAVGTSVNDAFLLSESYRAARTAFSFGRREGLLFVPALQNDNNAAVAFNIGQYKSSLTHAFDELDADALHLTITEIVKSFDTQQQNHTRAMDAACSLLYLSISLLPDGEKNVEQIFDDTSDGYRHLYKFTRTEECCAWMLQLRDGLCNILQSRKQSYKERIVVSVQCYIKEHLSQRLSLNEVASAFNFSPNYLSQLFAQYTDGGFVEYITETRVASAKALMATTDKKIYEISEDLGFESAFYFSKVFKKVTGQSPREYMQNKK